MALSANAPTVKTRDRSKTRTFEVKNAQALYEQGLVGLDANGLLVPWTDTAADTTFCGVFQGFTPALSSGIPTTVGNTSGEPIVRGVVRTDGAELYGVDVTGASARTQLGDPVYATSDDPDAGLTLAPTSFVKPVGFLLDYHSSTNQDVQLFTPREYLCYGSYFIWTKHFQLVAIADGNIEVGFIPGVNGRIVSWYAAAVVPDSTGSKLSTLNLEIDTVNCTGGTLALTSAALNAVGLIVLGSAFTAGQAFTRTSVIDMEAASTTSFVTGTVNLQILCQFDHK